MLVWGWVEQCFSILFEAAKLKEELAERIAKQKEAAVEAAEEAERVAKQKRKQEEDAKALSR